jgi:hypothetical protein
MGIEKLLEKEKPAVFKAWFELVIETYPPDTSQFFKSQKDPFANPVGQTISRSLKELLDLIIAGKSIDAFESALDPIVRIRAIQDFSPSQAVSFMFLLKKIVRKMNAQEIAQGKLTEDILQFESKVDELSLMAFNIYMKCRQKIYELQANEMKHRTFRAFERAGLVASDSNQDSDS